MDGKEGRQRFMGPMRKDTHEVASGNFLLHLFNHSCGSYRMGPYIIYLPRVGSTGCVQRAPAIRSWGVRALGWAGVAAFGKFEALRRLGSPGWAGWPDGAPTLRVCCDYHVPMYGCPRLQTKEPGLALAVFSSHTCPLLLFAVRDEPMIALGFLLFVLLCDFQH
jgi:hypothetical protein